MGVYSVCIYYVLLVKKTSQKMENEHFIECSLQGTFL